MALTGELSDLSLAELIEFFCNQRKTGCIEVKYPTGSAWVTKEVAKAPFLLQTDHGPVAFRNVRVRPLSD